MDVQVAAEAAKATKDKDVKRAEQNKKKRENRSFKKYGEDGKPAIDKVANRLATNKTKRENHRDRLAIQQETVGAAQLRKGCACS
jgi:hypothetical protein